MALFASQHKDLLFDVLKDAAPFVTIASLKEVSSVTGLLSYLSGKLAMQRLAVSKLSFLRIPVAP